SGWIIERFPQTIELLLKNGHEIALHGYVHERSNELTLEEEERVLDRALAAYAREVGGKPRGWRAPGFAFSKNSLKLLVRAGFEYDSSLMGDDVPYAVEGDSGKLLEFPVETTSDDAAYYLNNGDFSYLMPIQSPQRAIEVFRAEFDATRKYGALWTTVWHCFLSGRLARFDAVVQFIEYMREQGGVWFPRLDQVCDHVNSLVSAGRWAPRVEPVWFYDSPVPEFIRPASKR
ncbi:polysaccharide deacetylase family protein, partial [Bradyrhizobium macuxiense]|uniref:polysaccharide deacetylase family protein n=1 Tax=Bradyrhizobium macuxiense TaxID=1755647 RepID=UPI00142EA16A